MGVLSVVPKPNIIRDEKPKFMKALYVSGLNPVTTNDELCNYIVAYTPVTDKAKFNVHKMFKKDADISSWKYVSFKVEMNDDELNILDNVNLWPEGIRVREFQQTPKNLLSQHLPTLSTPRSASTETMEH